MGRERTRARKFIYFCVAGLILLVLRTAALYEWVHHHADITRWRPCLLSLLIKSLALHGGLDPAAILKTGSRFSPGTLDYGWSSSRWKWGPE
jgi:hypothetical protein